ncbi:MAG: response regulator transcription factor [Planctomycetota bacterium]|nr:response regulator transcription factor [Planctomycetota bacterium]
MTRGRILLVEDEAIGRELLARGLSRSGYEVETAADGVEAAALLEREFDFVVTDLVMPNADGLAVLAELNRRRHTALRIVVTSFADKDRVVAVLNLGADYLLEKPFGVEALGSVLERLKAERGDGTAHLAQFFRRRLLGLALTPREREMVELVLQGDSNKQIARKLGLSEQTVKNTLSHAYESLGVQSRGELFHAVFPV